MKRLEIVNKLLSEGFSNKTLVNFSDNEITMLANRIIFNEQEEPVLKISSDNKDAIKNAEDSDATYITYEEEIPEEEFVDLKEWVEDVLNRKIETNLTTKKEIMEKIKDLVSKNDKIVGSEPAPAEPVTKPTTKPSTKPTPNDPYSPSPGENPSPKGIVLTDQHTSNEKSHNGVKPFMTV